MATLRGQNFRILTYDENGQFWSCIGMATSCTVTLNANTESSETKDDIGAFAKPEVVSKSWQVQVESLNVADCGAILTAIKTSKKFYLKWDETSTTNNQTALEVGFSAGGEAYLSDVTFNFDNRTNSAKSLQFVGVSPLEFFEDEGYPTVVLPAGSYTKGQFVRLFLGASAQPTKVIAFARTLSLHVSVALENSTTKDTPGDFEAQEPTGISFDISTSALIRNGETITSSVGGLDIASLESLYAESDNSPIKFQIANTSGYNNRTKGAVIVSGLVVITSLTLNGPQRGQVADYTAQLSGYGEYTVGA